MNNAIVLKNLFYRYRSSDSASYVLNNINLNIEEGEFVAIVGANGSGKSTLAKHLNALLLPTSGSCVVYGIESTDSEDIWKIRQNVGMVFQNPDNQIVAAIVEEDVAFGPENIGLESKLIRKRVDLALEAVNMSSYKKQAPHMLSGGQKQRVAIAGVLALESKCMVLDEPTAMLDPLGRKDVLSTVIKLNKEKKITVVYITHFMQEAAMADRIVVMDKGEIVMVGTPKEIFSNVEEIKKLGLETTLAADISWQLREQGVNIPLVINNKELISELCR